MVLTTFDMHYSWLHLSDNRPSRKIKKMKWPA